MIIYITCCQTHEVIGIIFFILKMNNVNTSSCSVFHIYNVYFEVERQLGLLSILNKPLLFFKYFQPLL